MPSWRLQTHKRANEIKKKNKMQKIQFNKEREFRKKSQTEIKLEVKNVLRQIEARWRPHQ